MFTTTDALNVVQHILKGDKFPYATPSIALVPKLQFGNTISKAPAFVDLIGKLELPRPSNQAGAWLPAQTAQNVRGYLPS
ncbi:hypothetical protein DDY07_09930 [Methylomonas sp. ZR1]|nr:hypothetical protein [Methylomonas sp. ZR1]